MIKRMMSCLTALALVALPLSAQIDKKEAARLEKGRERVRKMEDKAAADGNITKKEKVKIEQAQDTQSKRIVRQKHDKQKAKK